MGRERHTQSGAKSLFRVPRAPRALRLFLRRLREADRIRGLTSRAKTDVEAPASVAATSAADSADAAGAEQKAEERPRGVIAEWTVTILLLLFGTTTLVQAFVIPTGSMEDSLLIGDHLLVDKLTYAPKDAVGDLLLPYMEVERGDIIVFRYPINPEETFVKRVIGVPGDRIRIINKQVWLNGAPLTEPYVVHKDPYAERYRDSFPAAAEPHVYPRGVEMLRDHVADGELVVPEGQYFALGDNRDRSLDSRYWGFVPRENIIGKPLIIYWSYDAPTAHLEDSSISIAHIQDVLLNFFSKTRWRRTFNLIHPYELEHEQ